MEPAFDFVAIGFGRIIPGVRHDFWAAGRASYRCGAVAWYTAVTEATA